MLNLPKSTEVNRQLPKKAIYEKFSLSQQARQAFDADISKIIIVNELSPSTTTIEKGTSISMFYVLHIFLKQQTIAIKNLELLSKLIDQKMLFVLEYEGKIKLAIYHLKLLHTDWQPISGLSLHLQGLNFDVVWDNIIVQVGGIQIENGNSLNEQILLGEYKVKLQKQMDSLEKQARSEKQPRKKFELVQQLQKLQIEMEEIL